MALKDTVRNGKVVKKIVRKKQASLNQPLTKRQELNNHIVCMRNTVNQVKVQITNRLNHQIRKYRKRKGNEEEKQKANRKADRLVEEIHALTKLKKDKASLYALLDTQKLDDVLNNTKASLEERVLARLSHHPLIQNDVKKYRDANPNWDMQISVLLEMTRQKKPKKEDATANIAGKADATSVEKSKEDIKSESEVDTTIKTDKLPCESQSESQDSSAEEEDDTSEEEDDTSEEEETQVKPKIVKPTPIKQNGNISKVDLGVKNSNTQTKPQSLLKNKSAGTVKVKFLKNLTELEEDSQERLTVDITKAPAIKRPKSGFFVGGVDEPKEDPPKDFQKPTYNRHPEIPSKPVFRKGKLVSKPPPRQASNFNQQRQGPPAKFGRPDNRFSGNSEPLESYPKRSRFSNDTNEKLLLRNPEQQQQQPQQGPAEKLHPSWEAKKKQQQISLTAFKGKKITFDNDD